MEKRSVFTEILAIAGTVFAALPLLAPVAFSLIRLARGGSLLFDWLIPAELFPLVLLGGLLLLWAALRARSRRAWMAGSLGLGVVVLVAGQVLVMVSGMGTGEVAAEGWLFGLVVASIVIYELAVVSLAVNGALLMRDLFRAAGRKPA